MPRYAHRVLISDRTLVAGAGVSGSSPLVGSLFYLQILQKDEDLGVRVGGFVSSTSAVDYPKASSSALACYKWLQGAAVGVSESSCIDHLTDVPEFRRV